MWNGEAFIKAENLFDVHQFLFSHKGFKEEGKQSTPGGGQSKIKGWTYLTKKEGYKGGIILGKFSNEKCSIWQQMLSLVFGTVRHYFLLK